MGGQDTAQPRIRAAYEDTGSTNVATGGLRP